MNLFIDDGPVTPAAVGTWNPADKDPDITLSSGDLVATINAGNNGFVRGTVGHSSGVHQFELTPSGDALNQVAGLSIGSASLDFWPGYPAGTYGYYSGNGLKYTNAEGGNPSAAYGATWTTGDVIGFVLDFTAGPTAGTLTAYKNGASQGVMFSGITGPMYPAWGPGSTSGSSRSCTLNCGQTAFAYPVGGAAIWG